MIALGDIIGPLGRSSISIGGLSVSQIDRGINLVIFDAGAMSIKLSETFDTYGDYNASSKLVKSLKDNAVPGDYVLLTSFDEASNFFFDNARDAIANLGAKKIGKLGFRSTYAMISQYPNNLIAEKVSVKGAPIIASGGIGCNEEPACRVYAVYSSNYGQDNRVTITRNGRTIIDPSGRGMNVVITKGDSVAFSGNFDTYSTYKESEAMIEYVTEETNQKYEGLVIVASKDEAFANLIDPVYEMMDGLGAELFEEMDAKYNYVFVGRTSGGRMTEAISNSKPISMFLTVACRTIGGREIVQYRDLEPTPAPTYAPRPTPGPTPAPTRRAPRVSTPSTDAPTEAPTLSRF